jgi:2-polyprenyl-6-methoxyphenol hydroxylase-like FAD-dependent oxidoreductase
VALIDEPEVAIVGGGVGGAALATVLARSGLSVAVVERDIRPVDRVRGEFMVPWGVTEAANLGLLDILRDAGGTHVSRVIAYDETVSPDCAEAAARDMRTVHSIGTGPLCAGHPTMCDALCSAAAGLGARVLRGVRHIAVAAVRGHAGSYLTAADCCRNPPA